MQVKIIARMGAMIIGRINAARKLDDETPIYTVVYVPLIARFKLATVGGTWGHSMVSFV
jgi:hypothetical protein